MAAWPRPAAAPSAEHPILVVEDDPLIRWSICSVLREEGLPVEAAVDGWDALERAALRRPALVVLDWHLPRLDGDQVAAGLRAAYPAGIPILLISADAAAPHLARQAHAYSCLGKPFDLNELAFAVWLGVGAPVPGPG